MAAIAFDTLRFARRLKEVGVPEAQAEAQAELMAEAFVFNMDALVTKDYLEQCLDSRFAAQDARIDKMFAAQDSRIDKMFAAQNSRIDKMFAAQDSRIDKKFSTQAAYFEKRLANHDLQFVEIRGELKLHRWMLALIVVTSVVPLLQQVFALLSG